MKDQIRNINKMQTILGSGNDPLSEINDLVLFETIGEYMKGCLDIEDVKNDPAFIVANETAEAMIIHYTKDTSGNKENKKFIREIFSSEANRDSLTDELNSINKEISDNKLNELTAEWVKEWHEKKQKAGAIDSKSEEIKNFITQSINNTASEPDQIVSSRAEKVSGRRLFARYASLSAAALLGVFILIRTLLPSSDTGKLFDLYYKPFDAFSPFTRSTNSNPTESYASAIESYRTGDYQKAAIGFTELMQKNQFEESSRFFLGLSQLAINNYSQAINLLAATANSSGEYTKEARWYLGLAYLKTANRQKATECFKYLARTGGYYRERSETILRRLR
jgi:TolA-binding protein